MDTPKVSIGMPVYNGERFLNQSIDSLLAQDYANIELIILDNDSTDGTAEICLSYIAKDKRIRYIRNDANIGPFENFNRVMQYAKGQYFMWAAYDDLREPSYISEMLTILESDSSVDLAFSLEKRIDEEGRQVFIFKNLHALFSGSESRFTPILKFIWYPNAEELASAVYGIFRTKVLQKTGGFQDFEIEYWGRDLHILLRVLLTGRFVGCNTPLFLKRLTAIKNKPYQLTQMTAIHPFIQALINCHEKFIGNSPNISCSGGSLSYTMMFLLIINMYLRNINNWKEIYKGYQQIISKSDLPNYQKNVLRFFILVRSLSKQGKEVPLTSYWIILSFVHRINGKFLSHQKKI